ncbi:MAG: thiamine-phosphate kinase [Alicyclobacillus sp.]|nr:thiamine-phosphate kinase [Alicyclobacillus sp.]
MDEFALIDHLCQRVSAAEPHVVHGVGDDAAVLACETGEQLLVSTDAMVEGTHFLERTMGWADVGFKAVMSAVSDIAAMGGQPRHLVVALAVPGGRPLTALEQLYDGLAEACQQSGCALVGGDVVRTDGPLAVTVTVLGAVPAGQALLRSGARPGDTVFVTGYVGSAAAGLAYLLAGSPVPADVALRLMQAHRRPLAQVTAGQVLRAAGAHSCNDISDGLASELNELARASGVRLRVRAELVPVAPEVRDYARLCGLDPLEWAWYGGEDYQLVGTAPPLAFARALAQCAALGVRLTAIGRVVDGDGVVVELPDGRVDVLAARGYNHFAADR